MKSLRTLLTMILLLSTSQSLAQVCGFLQASMNDARLAVNIADLQSYANKQKNYKVLNPSEFTWNSGSCICVEGKVSYDQEYGSDYLYMTVNVARLISEDLSGDSCAPIVVEAGY